MAAALLPLVALPTAGAATESLFPSPATVLMLSPIPGYIQDTLQGVGCRTNTCHPVDYLSFWTPGGVAAIDAAIDAFIAPDPDPDPDPPVVVFGYSHGAQVASAWLAEHSLDLDAPSAEKLSFVLMGNANRAYGGANVFGGQVMPQTQYKVIDISRQYDYTTDLPNNPFNLLAVANVLFGFTLGLHDYKNVNIDDPANAKWTVGNTTYILVPTPNLPLLEPLRWVGLNALADALNGPLKEMVEQGYNRPVPFPTVPPPPPPPPPPPLPPAASALSESVVSGPTVASKDATVPVNLAPARAAAADSAPTATRPVNADGTGTGLAVADTVTTTPTPDRADVPDTVKTITPATPKPGQDDAIAAKPSATAPTTHTTATSTTDGNKVEPGKLGENQGTTKGGDQAPSTNKDAPSTNNDSAPSTSTG